MSVSQQKNDTNDALFSRRAKWFSTFRPHLAIFSWFFFTTRFIFTHTLRAVGFSYASRERNHFEQPFDFPLSMCEVHHT